MKIRTNIPIKHFNVWYNLLNSHGGRFIENPVICYKNDYVSICYTIDVESNNKMIKEYQVLTQNIIEKARKPSIFNKMKKLFIRLIDSI